ncbi:hypothetical protein SESBI_30482 [Sesbania bispinosa]|nr:hypothetical protein SESBI_30482 [Sesbania bispinosa]
MVAKVMLEGGYQPGQVLGKFLNGVAKIPSPFEKKDRYGLGYQPTKANKRGFAEEKRKKRRTRLENREPETRGIPICDIGQSFRSAGLMFSYQVTTIGDQSLPSGDLDHAFQNANWVSPCFPDTKLTNWEIIEFPVTIKSGSK